MLTRDLIQISISFHQADDLSRKQNNIINLFMLHTCVTIWMELLFFYINSSLLTTSEQQMRASIIFIHMGTQIAKFIGPTWGPPCRPQMGPCWPHEPCYQGILWSATFTHFYYQRSMIYSRNRSKYTFNVLLIVSFSWLPSSKWNTSPPSRT